MVISDTKPIVLITDGLWRKSLSAIRSVGKAGYRVAVMGDSSFTTGFWSRFTTYRRKAVTAEESPDEFGASLTRALIQLRNKHKPILFLMEDASVMWGARHLSGLSKLCHVLLPPFPSLTIARDKGKTIIQAQKLGIPCPQTWFPDSCEDCIRLLSTAKPASYVMKPRTASGSAGILYRLPDTKEQLEKHWRQYGPMIVQERIPTSGAGLGVSILMDRESRCVASFAHKRLREYPISGGPSTDRISICAPSLVDRSIQLLKSLDWQGIAMVEWKEDPRDRTPKLLEINPRFWGSLELAIRSGVNFPFMYALVATGEKVKPVFTYRYGIRCRWVFPGEILRFVSQPRQDRESLPQFLRGILRLAEEYDRQDMRGLFAALTCTSVSAFNPKYWKYIKREL